MDDIHVVETKENSDGSLSIVFEVSESFLEWFKKKHGLTEWDNETFQSWVIQAINDYLRLESKS